MPIFQSLLKTNKTLSLQHNVCVHACTLYCGELECSSVERLYSLSLHSNIGLLQAVLLQQVVHL